MRSFKYTNSEMIYNMTYSLKSFLNQWSNEVLIYWFINVYWSPKIVCSIKIEKACWTIFCLIYIVKILFVSLFVILKLQSNVKSPLIFKKFQFIFSITINSLQVLQNFLIQKHLHLYPLLCFSAVICLIGCSSEL